MAVTFSALDNAANPGISGGGTVSTSPFNTTGPGMILISVGGGNNTTVTLASVTVNGTPATITTQLMPDGTSLCAGAYFWAASALTGAVVVATFTGSAGAGVTLIVNFAAGTDVNSIGTIAVASGTSGTTAISGLCTFNGSANYASLFNFGGTDTAGTNTAVIASRNDSVGDFGGSANNTQTTTSGTSYTVTTTHASNMWAAVLFEIKPAGSGASVTTLANENVPRKPNPRPTLGGLSPDSWSLQPLGSSSPIKSFLATEGMDRRPASTPRHTSVPWALTSLATPAIQTFLHQHPAIAPPWRGPRPQQQPWTGTPIVVTLPAMLVNDESQVIRPRRIRRWAPMGSLARATAGTEIFPLTPDSSGRFLLTAQGAPISIAGRTAWGIEALSASDRAEFLDDTIAHGFNAIEAQVPGNLANIWNNPFNANGDLPFLKKLDGTSWTGSFSGSLPDLTTPNPAFWSFHDGIVSDCRARGLLYLWFPMYLGHDLSEGWLSVMSANGTSNTQAFGAFVASRYATQPHIVWMTAGDTNNGNTEEGNLITGLKSVPGQRSLHFSAERGGGTIATDGPGALGLAMTLNGAYDWGTVIAMCRRAYAHGIIPAFMVEEPYDEEGTDGTNVNGIASQPTRRWEWWGQIETIGGYVAGNGYIWRFAPSGTPLATDNWKNHKDTQSTRDLGRLNTFWRSIPWWTLVPSAQGTMATLVTAGGGTIDTGDYVAAACNPTGSLWVGYAGPDRASTFTVDMTVMRGTASAKWFNPADSTFTSAGSIPNTGSHTFTVPGDNGTGFSDWALMMTA